MYNNEEIIDKVYYLEGLTEEEEKELNFYRTKDKQIAAYLKARGYKLRGMEKILIGGGHRKKKIVVFCFDGSNVTRRAILEYYNSDDPKLYTVNGKLVLSEFRNINSMIANF